MALAGLVYNGISQNTVATHPLTALCVVGLSVAVLFTKRFGGSSRWRLGLLSGIVLICVARLMDAALSALAGATTFAAFGPFSVFNGTFSVAAALTLGAFGLAALVRQGGGRWGGVFLVAGLATVFNTFVSMSYGSVHLARDVSVFTQASLVLVSLAMLSVHVHRPFVRVAFLMGDIGAQTRIMAAAIMVLPWTLGFGLVLASGWGTAGPAQAVLVSVTTCSLLIILMASSALHEGSFAARRRAEREIAMLSRVDPVTGALNQFGITEALEGAWLEFRSTGAYYGMILVDLEYFRNLDQTFGQSDGEGVLGRVAATLGGQLRDTDALGRWGRDEFLVLLKIKDNTDVDIVATRLRRALSDIKEPFCAGLSVEPATIDVPFGLSVMADRDRAPTDAVMRADGALFAAKTSGQIAVGVHAKGWAIAGTRAA